MATTTSGKKSAGRAAAKKSAAKKTTAKKSAVKKSSAKKSTAKSSTTGRKKTAGVAPGPAKKVKRSASLAAKAMHQVGLIAEKVSEVAEAGAAAVETLSGQRRSRKKAPDDRKAATNR